MGSKTTEIIENQQAEYNDLVKIATLLLDDSFEENFFIDTSKDIPTICNNELLLEKYSNFIREKWKKKVCLYTLEYYKSPEYNQNIKTLNKTPMNFAYERSLKPESLEKDFYINKENYIGFSILFNSGMSALMSIYSMTSKLLSPQNKVIKGLTMIGYFESIALLAEYRKTIDLDYLLNDNSIPKYSLDEYDFYIIEPTRTNLSLDKNNIENFVEEIAKQNNSALKIIVFDTSLLGTSFDISEILNKLKHKKNLIIVNLRSGLKLDQQGLEFSNCGLIDIYLSDSLQKLQEYIYSYLVNYRRLSGTGLTFEQVCLLDNSLSFKENEYSEKILINNYQFFEKLNAPSGEIIEKIIYPFNKKIHSMYRTPYLYLKLSNSTEEENQKLLMILKMSLEHFNLHLPERNSFGFRNLSAEYFMNLEDSSFIFKIAIGKLQGVKFFLVRELINIILELDEEPFQILYNSMKNREGNNELTKK